MSYHPVSLEIVSNVSSRFIRLVHQTEALCSERHIWICRLKSRVDLELCVEAVRNCETKLREAVSVVDAGVVTNSEVHGTVQCIVDGSTASAINEVTTDVDRVAVDRTSAIVFEGLGGAGGAVEVDRVDLIILITGFDVRGGLWVNLGILREADLIPQEGYHWVGLLKSVDDRQVVSGARDITSPEVDVDVAFTVVATCEVAGAELRCFGFVDDAAVNGLTGSAFVERAPDVDDVEDLDFTRWYDRVGWSVSHISEGAGGVVRCDRRIVSWDYLGGCCQSAKGEDGEAVEERSEHSGGCD